MIFSQSSDTLERQASVCSSPEEASTTDPMGINIMNIIKIYMKNINVIGLFILSLIFSTLLSSNLIFFIHLRSGYLFSSNTFHRINCVLYQTGYKKVAMTIFIHAFFSLNQKKHFFCLLHLLTSLLSKTIILNI